jgi:hypothetical protein
MVRSKGDWTKNNAFMPFLLSIEFGFYVDQRGRWIRSSHIMEWEGEPDAFALSYPYLVAFEPGFIEIRNILSVSSRGKTLIVESIGGRRITPLSMTHASHLALFE